MQIKEFKKKITETSLVFVLSVLQFFKLLTIITEDNVSKFLFEMDIDNLVSLFSFCMQVGADPNNLVYVIAPPSEHDLPHLHKIVGLVDRYNGNFHIPSVICPSCGITENAMFGKKSNSNYVACSKCGMFCYTCILQTPIKSVLAVVLNKIDPVGYPIEDEEYL